ARNGHELTVVTAATWGAPAGARPAEYGLIRVPEFRHFSNAYRTSMPPLPWSPQFARAVTALRRAEVVNAHGYGCPLVDVLGLFVPGRRIVYTLHGFLYRIPTGGGPLGAVYRAYDALLGKRVLDKSAIVTAVSSWVAGEARKRGRDGVVVVPNGCTPAAALPLSPAVAGEAEKGPFVLGIGRLQHFKGYEVAIDALAALRRRGRTLRLLIAGSDAGHGADLRAQAERLGVSDAVGFLGHVPPGEVATLLQRSVAFVLTSHSESFSIATLEALNAGAPAILSRLGGPLDIATEGETALFFTDGDAAGLAANVERLLDEPALRASLIERGRVRARDFDWDRVAERYETLYREVALR
ncbi:MAG TPA: glycosyltransferase family 4 protein, partial [Candidatus Acidoferrales bacterium]|nr:glycosyltransferase family 4 protein [Candidatus Acidoferrales bacterium]